MIFFASDRNPSMNLQAPDIIASQGSKAFICEEGHDIQSIAESWGTWGYFVITSGLDGSLTLTSLRLHYIDNDFCSY